MEKTLARILLQVESEARTNLLEAGLTLLASRGAGGMTLRAVEEEAGLTHGSVRHHFSDRRGFVAAMFTHLADREEAVAKEGDVVTVLQRWLGPDRALTLARYELFLLAARDPELRAGLLQGRQRFTAIAASYVGAEAAPTIVAALDGVLLDALVRDAQDHESSLRVALSHLGLPEQPGQAISSHHIQTLVDPPTF